MRVGVAALVSCVVVTTASAAPDDPPPPPDKSSTTEPSPPPPATTPPQSAASPSPTPASPARDEEDHVEPFSGSLYGYIDTQFRTLTIQHGLPTAEANNLPNELAQEKDPYTVNLNVMAQGHLFEKFHWFINLGAIEAGDPARGDVAVGIRNAWVEAPLYREHLILRVGKTYRRFGLYNEILDAAPTFPGVEQPEFLVEGQLLTTRTTNVMLHGSWINGRDRLMYALHTGMDEAQTGVVPIGGDVRYSIRDTYLFGTSFYWTGGAALPSRQVGDGLPQGGVKDWMTDDNYYVFGGYVQVTRGPLLLQVEYWNAQHNAHRNPLEVIKFATAATLTPAESQRFVNGVANPTIMDVNINARYAVQTFWARLAYEIDLHKLGTLQPYIHLDWYSDPESFEGAALGGNETGLYDDNQLYRVTVGTVYRPVPAVALKVELNPHIGKVQGVEAVYVPIQASLSYAWKVLE